MDFELYEDDPRDFALELCYSGLLDFEYLAIACIKYMSHDEVKDMLDANELSPRFMEND